MSSPVGAPKPTLDTRLNEAAKAASDNAKSGQTTYTNPTNAASGASTTAAPVIAAANEVAKRVFSEGDSDYVKKGVNVGIAAGATIGAAIGGLPGAVLGGLIGWGFGTAGGGIAEEIHDQQKKCS